MLDILISLQTYERSILVVGTLMTVLTTLALVLRLISRWMANIKLGSDDWLIIAAQVLWYPNIGLEFYGVVQGAKASSLFDSRILTYSKYVYLCSVFYFPMVLATNLSVLFFYRRLFFIDKKFIRLSLVLIIITTLWSISGFFSATFMCTPINTLWTNPMKIDDNCIWYAQFFITMMSTELFLDTLILALPIRQVIKLKMTWQKRSMLGGIFCLGGFAIVTGIVRLAYCYEPSNPSIDYAINLLWLNVHVGTSIICACLPTFGPLVTKLTGDTKKTLEKLTRKSNGSNPIHSGSGTGSGNTGTPLGSRTRDFKKNLDKVSPDDRVQLVGTHNWASRGASTSERPSNGYIKVERTVDIV